MSNKLTCSFLRRHTRSRHFRTSPAGAVGLRLLELLEDRSVPAAINWTNTAGGSWHVPANWDLNRVPIAGDGVVVPSLSGSLTITYSTGNKSINSLILCGTVIEGRKIGPFVHVDDSSHMSP